MTRLHRHVFFSAIVVITSLFFAITAAQAQPLTKKDAKCKFKVAKSLVKIASRYMRVRADCATQQAIGTIAASVDCLEDPFPDGAGTGAANIDERLRKVGSFAEKKARSINKRCATPERTPATIQMDTLCTPATANWLDMMACGAAEMKTSADAVSRLHYHDDANVGVLDPSELGCRSALARKLANTLLGSTRQRAKCFLKRDLGKGMFTCMATVGWPGQVAPTDFTRADNNLTTQLSQLRQTVLNFCNIDLGAAGFESVFTDHTGLNAFTAQDLFQALDDAMQWERIRVAAVLFPGFPYCGDGIVNQPEEQCDDGNRDSCDGCDRDCTSTGTCGNGASCGLEECDDGNNVDEDGCSATCSLEQCGDFVVQTELGEACDDGNLIDCDGCDSNCTFSVLCNNGVVCASEGEQCDDGLGICLGGFSEFQPCISDDDCLGSCEDGPNAGKSCNTNADCNVSETDEFECHRSFGCGGLCSGGSNNNNKCLSDEDCPGKCTAQAGLGQPCTTSSECPDGLVCNNANTCTLPALNNACFEDADCGTGGMCISSNGCNTGNSDTLSDRCRNNCLLPSCGDAVTDFGMGETCDDGKQCEDATDCTDDATVCSGIGDGTCAQRDGDGCDSNCTVTRCGNGIVTPPEECDDGSGTCDGGFDDSMECLTNADCRGVCASGANVGDVCSPETAALDCDNNPCTVSTGCTGGNNDPTPGSCRVDCTLPRCGDGVVDTDLGEQCDEGEEDGICSGGYDNGLGCTADADCLGYCGMGQETCGSNADCLGECVTGPNIDHPCTEATGDADCLGGLCSPGQCVAADTQGCVDGFCDGGITGGRSCSTNADCYGLCGNGPGAGQPCEFTADCLGQCVTGPNLTAPCTEATAAGDCGGGVCKLTTCTEATGCGGINSDTFPDACRTLCTLPYCGDGVRDPDNLEQCDDGNGASGDCCTPLCVAEDLGTQTCGIGACMRTVPVCVDGEPNLCVPAPPPSSEGPIGDPTCSDSIDNDCDGLTDGADLGCQ
jgi:cysteine-rich repeat protein